MARRIMHIDLDAFFVSVEQVLNPELKGKPVVVGGRPDRRGVVAAASYEARAFGSHAGMPLTTTSRLCPQAIFIESTFPKYCDASQKFISILVDFSPHLEPVTASVINMALPPYKREERYYLKKSSPQARTAIPSICRAFPGRRGMAKLAS